MLLSFRDRFTSQMTAYPGRSFGQLYHRFAKGNAMVTGSLEIGDHEVSLSAIDAPVLVFAGATDGIAPVEAVRAVVPLLTGAREVRFEIVPGGHLGMLTGRGARSSTWRVLDDWIRQWSGAEAPTAVGTKARPAKESTAKKAAAKKAASKKAAAKKATVKKAAAKAPATRPAAAKKAAAKKAATKKTATKKAATKKTATKKSATRKTATKKTAASAEGIGANPRRRYGSAGSRALSR